TLEDRVEEHAVLVTLQHDLLHPVIEDLVRHATHLLEGEDMAVADAVDIGVEEEADVLPSAVAQHEREAHHGRGDTRKQHRIRRQVDLPLHAGLRLEARVRLDHRRRPEAPHPILDDGVASLVADRADLLQHAHHRERVGQHELLDEWLERIELARPLLPLPFLLATQDRAYGLRVNRKLACDGLVAKAFALEPLDQLISPLPALALAPEALLPDPTALTSRQSPSASFSLSGPTPLP